MAVPRTVRLNSLLKEVISEVIRTEVRNPRVSELSSITRVDITNDLHYAKVYVSVLGTEEVKTETLKALRTAAGFISSSAANKIVIRHFPKLSFILDETVEKQIRIEEVLKTLRTEKSMRQENTSETP